MKKKFASCIILLICLFPCFAAVKGVRDLIVYDSAITRSVEVKATVAELEEYEDSEGATQYDLYISYTYDGKTYRPEYDVKKASAWRNRIGETITIRIDPENPAEPITNLTSGRWFIYVGIVMVHAVACLSAGILDKHLDRGFLPDHETLHGKVCAWVRHRLTVPLTAIFLALSLELLHWRYPRGFEGMFLHIVGFVLIALALWRLRRVAQWFRMANNLEYEVVYGKLVEKIYDEGDSDSAATYDLRFTDGSRVWTKRVDAKTYHTAREGTSGMVVYLPNRKVEILTF